MSNGDDSQDEAYNQLDMFGGEHPAKPLTPIVRRILGAAEVIGQEPPDQIDFLHAVLCQVGMPRKATPGRIFERTSGNASMVLEAGRLYSRGKWIEQPLPYGTRPRLVMVHVSGEAVRQKTREIDVGESVREFLIRLGIDTNGGPRGGYTMFKKQMQALAASRLTLGMSINERDITINTQPISRFEAWLQNDGKGQTSMWPGIMQLSQEFYDTLVEHAVPLDHTALGALKHSALDLDIYTWLAHRLCRVSKPGGVKVSWMNMKEQFGQEYKDSKSFKKEFRQSLSQVRAVYQDARIEEVPGGLLLKPSHPPIARKAVQVLLPGQKEIKPKRLKEKQ